MPHHASSVAPVVTVSIGVAMALPTLEGSPEACCMRPTVRCMWPRPRDATAPLLPECLRLAANPGRTSRLALLPVAGCGLLP
jgi:hypothetical protein